MAYAFTSVKSKELFEIKQTRWHENQEVLCEIRRIVFVEEQGVSAEEEWDGLDELDSTLHFYVQKVEAAEQSQNSAIATARVLEDGKIGRMCVRQDYRGHGIGKALLQEILNVLIEQHKFSQVYLYAQTSARVFYETVGFETVGEIFMEAGIEHIRMELNISDSNSLLPIYQDRVIRLSSAFQFQLHLRQLLLLGRHSLDIMSHSLSTQIFSQIIADEISKLARNHRQSHVRILLEDTKALVGITHPVVQLSQRLSSSVVIKKLCTGPEMGHEAFVIVDRCKLLYFNDEGELDGFARYSAAAECEHQLQHFEHLWQTYGETDPELNRLHI